MSMSSYKSYEDEGFSVTWIVDATAESACRGATSSADLASTVSDMQQFELNCKTSSIELWWHSYQGVLSKSGQKIFLSSGDNFGKICPGHNIMDLQMDYGKAKMHLLLEFSLEAFKAFNLCRKYEQIFFSNVTSPIRDDVGLILSDSYSYRCNKGQAWPAWAAYLFFVQALAELLMDLFHYFWSNIKNITKP